MVPPAPLPDQLPSTEPSLGAAHEACLNCGHVFVPQRLDYCPACGQETRLQPPTLRELAQQFGGSYIAAEGALWRTLKLLPQPGALTREYLAGRRRRYVLPLRLYLTISLVVLLLMRMVSEVDMGAAAERAAAGAPVRAVTVLFGFGAAGLREGTFFCDGLPAWMCRRLEHKLDRDANGLARQVKGFLERALSNVSMTMFVLLPAFAGWLRLLYRNRCLRYTEHLVFALHLHAFGFLMLGLSFIDLPGAAPVAAVALAVYTWLALRAVYGGRWGPRLLRVLALLLLHLAAVGLTMLGFWVLVVLT